MKYATLPSPQVIHQNAVDHGWYDGVTPETIGPDFIPSKLALVHSEVTEALEAFRNNNMTPHLVKNEDGSTHLAHFSMPGEGAFDEELADAVIRIFDLAGFLDIDLETAIHMKHEYNKTRPHCHGGKVV